MGHLQVEWLDIEENLESWEMGLTASERRILLTKWAADSYQLLIKKEDTIKRWFEKGGLLITTNGSNDEKITPENLNYEVPPINENESVPEETYGHFLPCDR